MENLSIHPMNHLVGWMVDGRMDGWTDGRMDGWTDGRMDGWMEFNHL